MALQPQNARKPMRSNAATRRRVPRSCSPKPSRRTERSVAGIARRSRTRVRSQSAITRRPMPRRVPSGSAWRSFPVDEAQRAFENAQHDASVAQTELNNAERAVSAFAAAQRSQQAAEEAAKQAAEPGAARPRKRCKTKRRRSSLPSRRRSICAPTWTTPRSRQREPRPRGCVSRRRLLKRRRDAAQQAVEQNAQQLATKRELLAAKDKQLAELPAGDAAAAAKERNELRGSGQTGK